MVQRPIELARYFQLGCGLAPLPRSVERQAGDLVSERHFRQIPQDRLHHPTSVVVATPVQGVRCGRQALAVLGGACCRSRFVEIVRHVWGEVTGLAPARRLEPASAIRASLELLGSGRWAAPWPCVLPSAAVRRRPIARAPTVGVQAADTARRGPRAALTSIDRICAAVRCGSTRSRRHPVTRTTTRSTA